MNYDALGCLIGPALFAIWLTYLYFKGEDYV